MKTNEKFASDIYWPLHQISNNKNNYLFELLPTFNYSLFAIAINRAIHGNEKEKFSLFSFHEKCEMLLKRKRKENFISLSNSQLSSTHSMATANLKKNEDLVTNTTAASKYIPRRTRISIYWNPSFRPHFIKGVFSKTSSNYIVGQNLCFLR